MATCEMCGAQVNSLISVKVAGSIMKVCNSCKSMGTQMEVRQNNLSHTFMKTKKTKVFEEVISDYASKIQSTIAKRGLNVHQLARAVNIKESTLTNYLKGKIKPDISDAKKLEKFLEISLVIESETSNSHDSYLSSEVSSEGMSLGDLLKKQLEGNK